MKTTILNGGSLVKRSALGNSASLAAMATGSGRSAPSSTTGTTSAVITAAGGTPHSSMKTSPMIGGSHATSSTMNGGGAEYNWSFQLLGKAALCFMPSLLHFKNFTK